MAESDRAHAGGPAASRRRGAPRSIRSAAGSGGGCRKVEPGSRRASRAASRGWRAEHRPRCHGPVGGPGGGPAPSASTAASECVSGRLSRACRRGRLGRDHLAQPAAAAGALHPGDDAGLARKGRLAARAGADAASAKAGRQTPARRRSRSAAAARRRSPGARRRSAGGGGRPAWGWRGPGSVTRRRSWSRCGVIRTG